ncbi:MAG: sodium/proton-translocating pyrophosphatase, partial [Chloroflexota bacterium]|nr:sodium/proton-translocating pyrophosphatase [Chloroflexota bacterium]
ITQYYTAGEWRPVRHIADAARTGPATIIIAGIAIGFENTALPVLVLVSALGSSYFFGVQAVAELGLTVQSDFISGVYGTAVATMGMLMSAAYILAMDTFGPISDNAGGIAEFSHAGKETREITDSLDSVGNTTKALTKGYAVGSAALTAFVLLSAFIQKAEIASNTINLADVRVFIGAFLGAMVVYLFCALAIRAVGVSSSTIIEEVRRQFREHPGIMTGEERPEYGRAVDIAAASALRNMILPGLLPVIAPLAVGLILRAEAAAGFLMIGAISGVVLGLVLNNGGGAWDNAKKFIEAGGLKDADGNPYPKGSDEHAAAVVGDTVGDPFKDTAGPSLNVLIKILSTITLVLTPLFV